LKDDLIKAIQRLQDRKSLQDQDIKSHLHAISISQDCVQQDIAELSSRMRTLQDSLQSFANKTKQLEIEQTVIDSLTYQEVDRRFEQVAHAHQGTFQWVFDQPFSAGPNASQTFAQWLRSDDHLCWIAGKPGSGKSTLMKRILQDERTQEELRKWASGTNHELCVGSYFFWIGGTPLQKSQEGLLRSLLHDVFRQAPEIIHTVCEERRLTSSALQRTFKHPWTRAELFRTFGALGDRTTLSKKYCFFIDGLDEYKLPDEGDYDDLIQLMQRFSSRSNFKFCVSSREENEFRDEYLKVNHFILHHLTRQDIENLVHQRLNENHHFQRLAANVSTYLDLEWEIVRKAQGVFLWVSLVVKTLLDGMRNSDTIADLHRELNDLPDTLEVYFQRIIESIEPRYRVAAAKTLQVTNQAERPLPLLAYYFLDEEGKSQESFHPSHSLSSDEVDQYHEDARRRLSARCRGLLEVVEYKSNSQPLRFSVVYLHRTVRDFLYETSKMQILFEKMLPPDYVAQRESCKAFLCLLKQTPCCPRECGCSSRQRWTPHNPFDSLLEDLLFYANYMWEVRGDPQIELLREAEKVVLMSPKHWRQFAMTPFLGLALQSGLFEYVRIRVEETPSLLGPSLLDPRDRPVLRYALPIVERTMMSWVRYKRPSNTAIEPRIDMLELLLQVGAPIHERRVFGPFIRQLLLPKWAESDAAQRRMFVSTFALLVKHGVNLDETIISEYIRQKGVSHLDNSEFRIDMKRKAREIMAEFFSDMEMETILRHRPDATPGATPDVTPDVTRGPKKSWWSWFTG
jgi:transcriptional regulator of met regulon